MTRLDGRVAVITGASRGLGKSIALALGAAGARLALVARDVDKLKETAAAARACGAEAEAFRADLRDEAQVAEAERQIASRFGDIHILINNAGTNVRKPLTEFTLDEWYSVIDTSMTATFLMCRAFLPHMRRNGYGRIVNLTSTMAHVALPHRTAYAAAKHGELGFTKALALELATEGITVNGISPGPFATEMNVALMKDPEVYNQFTARVPMGRWGKLEEVGRLAVYLCSDDAAFITGTDVLIDGGWCAQ